ncbi:MAG: hypothetical protein NTY90_03485 [Candidatus Micrarchaeota archaeon]|nr:hypothetical protein [Candidatus Micrarchaeota archaeon]
MDFRTPFLLLVFLSLLQFSAALGISPGRIDIPFQPNLTTSFSFRVIPHSAPFVKFTTRGDLAQYISFPVTQATIPIGSSDRFTFDVRLPQALSLPGLHDTRIVVTEYPRGFQAGAEAGVGAKVAVELQFWVRVPYPGKYLEVTKFMVGNVPSGKNAPIELGAINRGNESIANASTVFEIFDASGALLATIPGGWRGIGPGENAVFEAAWPTGENPPGYYYANATLAYDRAVKQLSTRFKVGAELVKITNISADDIAPGGIARFKVDAESFWAEDIPGVFIETNVLNAGDPTARSESKTIEAWGKQSFLVFWDSKKNNPGTYDVDVTVHFLGKTQTEKTTLRIVGPSNEIPWPLVIGALSLAIILYLAYRFLLPRLRPLAAGKKKKRGVSGELDVRCTRAGEAVEFVLRASNNSGEPIDSEALFEVFAEDGTGVASVSGGKKKIDDGGTTEFSAKMPASKTKAGNYLATATLSYGEKEGVVERKFSLRAEEKPPWEKYR